MRRKKCFDTKGQLIPCPKTKHSKPSVKPLVALENPATVQMEVVETKRALIILGLGSTFTRNPRAYAYENELKSQGYEVEVILYHEALSTRQKNTHYDLVIGHSAGATRAELEFGNVEGTEVVSIASPTRFGGNNIRYAGNAGDPVSVLGVIMQVSRIALMNPGGRATHYTPVIDDMRTFFWGHDKNKYLSKIQNLW